MGGAGGLAKKPENIEAVSSFDFDKDSLDDEAKVALEEIGYEASEAILQDLAAKGENVRNPSAYVLRAVGNARIGKGAGGLAISGEAPEDGPSEAVKAAQLNLMLAEG